MVEKTVMYSLKKRRPQAHSSSQQGVEGKRSIILENNEVCDNNKTGIGNITVKKCQYNQNEQKTSLLNKR